MANSFPTSANNYTGNETLFAAGHAGEHNALEAKLGISASTPVANTVLRGTGTGASAWAQINVTSDITGTLPVANGGTGVTASTGTVAVVLSTSPTLITPILGAATATSINKVAITPPATTATLTIANNAQVTFGGAFSTVITSTAGTTVTLPTTGTLATLAGNETLTSKTLTSPILQGNVNGWTVDTNAWTYSSADGATGVLTINADLTGVIQAGDRIWLTQTTSKYFLVSKNPTFGGGNTTLTIWGGTDYTLANAAITGPYYSHQKSPFGFNTDPTKWTVRVTDSTDRSQASAAAGTWYNLGTTNEQITIPIGTWNVTYNVNLQQNAAAVVAVFATLSTANNSESDSEFSVNINSTAAFAGGVATKSKTLTVASKTIYYLNTSTSSGATPTIYNRNSTANGSILIIESRSAYL